LARTLIVSGYDTRATNSQSQLPDPLFRETLARGAMCQLSSSSSANAQRQPLTPSRSLLVPRDMFAALGAPMRALPLALADAAPQRVQQIDDIARPLFRGGHFDLFPGGLLPHQLAQRALVLVLEFSWIEMRGLAVENMFRELDHVPRHARIGNVRGIHFFVAHLVVVAQRGADETLAERFERN